ncbi:C-type lectin 37Db-like [Drosophila ficusphila]|uniref:C-type lectin 37Db-like n=1 Tax=Drosophila ficusphila TaxID=30025 RepID=UPI0007E674BD|nr:C-type lectin 37Db-like [Drosophila ficusphila]
MLKSITYCLVLFLTWYSYESLAKDTSVCLLHDQPNQCGAFCLQALRPLIDHTTFNKQKLENLETKLEAIIERQLSAIQKLQCKRDKKSLNLDFYDRIGSKWIYVERENPRNWEQAEAFCREIEGHLLTIQNDIGLRVLDKKLDRDTSYWLGINDMAKKDEFVSVASGKPAPFLKWEDTEPDNWNGKENCVDIYNGEMYDTECSFVHLFICEATFD